MSTSRLPSLARSAASLRCWTRLNGVQARACQAAQGGRFGQSRGISPLRQRARRGRADRDGWRATEQAREVLLTERALELRDRGRTGEGDGAYGVPCDPRAAVVHIE